MIPFVWPWSLVQSLVRVNARYQCTYLQRPLSIPALSPIPFDDQAFAINMLPRFPFLPLLQFLDSILVLPRRSITVTAEVGPWASRAFRLRT